MTKTELIKKWGIVGGNVRFDMTEEFEKDLDEFLTTGGYTRFDEDDMWQSYVQGHTTEKIEPRLRTLFNNWIYQYKNR